KGEVSRSPHRNGTDDLQQVLLEAEGIKFNKSGKVDLKRYRWIADSDLLEAAIARVHQSQLVDSVDEN
ncbi:MAG: hypothetical protein AAF892_15350, partial [Cyanobacteria bacterium P01_D01_bin.71]